MNQKPGNLPVNRAPDLRGKGLVSYVVRGSTVVVSPVLIAVSDDVFHTLPASWAGFFF